MYDGVFLCNNFSLGKLDEELFVYERIRLTIESKILMVYLLTSVSLIIQKYIFILNKQEKRNTPKGSMCEKIHYV